MSNPKSALYALADCAVQPIDARSIMLIRYDNGAVAAVDAQWRKFLHLLQSFRTLRQHAEIIARMHPEAKGMESQLEAALTQLLPRGVLRGADEVVGQLEHSAQRTPANLAPLTICIRTCDRPDMLARLLESLADNARTFDTQWPIEVLEDSRDAGNRERNRSLVENAPDPIAIRYIGIDEQQALIAELEGAGGADEQHSLRWLLDPAYADHRERATHGRLYNLAFMLHAGQRILLVDDDVIMQAWRWPNAQWNPSFQLAGGGNGLFLNPAAARSAIMRVDEDPIAHHDRTLGLPVAQAVTQLTGARLDVDWLSESPFGATPHPYARVGRVRYTHNGYFGDTGTVCDNQMLYDLPRLAPRILTDPAAYQEFIGARRCRFTAGRRPELLSGNHFQHTTCAGIDLRDELPPVLPTGRGEDTLFGRLLRLTYPDDYGLRLPFALEHRQADAAVWRVGADYLTFSTDASAALGLWASLLRAPAEVSPAQRLDLLTDSILATQADGHLAQRLTDQQFSFTQENLAVQFATIREHLSIQAVQINAQPQPIAPDSPWRAALMGLEQDLLARLQNPDDGRQHYQQASDNQAADLVRYCTALPIWREAYRRRVQQLRRA